MTNDQELDKLLIDGIREMLGLSPLYAPEGRPSETERFGHVQSGWWRTDGRKHAPGTHS